MTPQQIDAMKMALEALKTSMYPQQKQLQAIASLEETLAEHAMRETQRLGQEIEQEPVQTRTVHITWNADGIRTVNGVPDYTQPPQRTWANVPDEEIKILWIQYRAALPRYLCFAKALLARAKEENT